MITTPADAAAAVPRAPAAPANGGLIALGRRLFRDARIRTITFAYLFAAYSYIQPVGYRHTYPAASERVAFAASFANNTGLRLLYGRPHDLLSVGGYCAWRVGGVLAIASAFFGLLAAVRALRAEEDAGRMEIVLAGEISRRSANRAALAALAAGIALLWLAEFAGFFVGGLPTAGAAYLALATASVAPVFVGVGALASQLASTRRGALGLGGAILAVTFLTRVLADTVAGAGWLRWSTPLGWAEELRPFAGPQPLALLLPVVSTVLLLTVAARLGAGRDVGTGVWPAHDSVDPRLWLLSSPTALALRGQTGTLIAWVGAVAAFMFILGGVSHAISPADVPENVQKQIAKLGAGSIVTPTGYLAFVFIFVIVAISAFACAQVAAARQEEVDQRLEVVLAQPVSRSGWLLGRLLLAATGSAVLSLTAGLFTWAGARAAGVRTSLPTMLEAGANAMPTALLFLGIAALAYAILPRASNGIAYGLLTMTFVWQLAGSLLGPPRWVLDLTPFAHVALVPAQPLRPAAAAIMTALGLLAAGTAVAAFRQRDLMVG
jgi:ABC-2 type transport system permease protein